jgi:hypothetical protein
MRRTTMKKYTVIALALALGLSAMAAAQPILRDAPRTPPFEFSLFGGIGLSQIKGTTNYQDQWYYNLLTSVTEQTAIATNAKRGYGGGGSLAYYFSPNFGLQVLFGYMKADIPNTAVCDFGWTWSDGTSFAKTGTWPGTGSFSSMPLSLDLVGKFGGGVFEALFSAGVTMFMNTFEQNSFFGYGVTRIQYNADSTYTQYVDALKVGLKIPNGTLKRNAYGFNFGAGFTFNISDMIGIRADARYYYCPEQTVTWDFVLGNYDGIFFGDIKAEPFADADVQLLQDLGKTFAMTVNPSFIQISLGLVFHFGSNR